MELTKAIPICDSELSTFTSVDVGASHEYVIVAAKIHCGVILLCSLNIFHKSLIRRGEVSRVTALTILVGNALSVTSVSSISLAFSHSLQPFVVS